ncbi:MAG: O-methyltransferase [Solirubrobacteraceae bacterium]
MTSTLSSDRVQAVLARLQADGKAENERYKQRVHARESELGTKFYGRERAELGATAPLSIAPEVGHVLYALTLAARPTLIVEFGASLGVSTIYLASALRDNGSGSIITTELLPDKAEHAAENLADARLGDLVEMRVGDALDSLSTIDSKVDLLFLDGSNDLYLPVLELLEPSLSSRGMIVADMSHDDPHHERYRDHVSRGYLTTEVPLDAGLVISAASEATS